MSRRYWYGYISPGDVFDPASYRLVSITPTCSSGTTICALYAHGGDVNPVLGPGLTQYITNSITVNTAQPQLGVQKFLYKKS